MNLLMQFILEHRWAMVPEALEQMIVIAGRGDYNPVEVAKAVHGSEQWQKYISDEGKFAIDAIETVDAPRLDGAYRARNRDGVALLPVIGPIFPRSNLMTASGATSVTSLAKDFKLALTNDNIEAIVLEFDTPGGEVTGISEFGQLIRESRGEKPIIAYATGLCASAGYWLASQCDEIVVSSTAELGSIGVIATFTDSSARDEKAGIKQIKIVSSISPLKAPDLRTQEGLGKIQRIVDTLGGVFVAEVATGRGVDKETVLTKYGKGDLFVGVDAIENGLADRQGTLEMVIDEQLAKLTTSTEGSIFMNLQELKSNHEAVYNEVIALGKEEGRKEGVASERKRIQEIESIKAPGAAEIIAKHKFDEGMDKGAMSILILDKQSEAADRRKKAITEDGNEVNKGASQIDQETPEGEHEATEDQIVEAMVEGGNNARS